MRIKSPLLAVCLATAPLSAQVPCDPGFGDLCPVPESAPRWHGHAISLGVNAMLGGVTAGVGHSTKGTSFWRGFARGAAGGGLAYGGRWVGAQRFHGAGLLGRQAGAVGASLVNNAARGRGALDRIVLPVGPVRLYLQPAAHPQVRAKVDLAAVLAAGYVAAQEGSRLNIGSSLSAGAVVFAMPEEYTGPRGAPIGVSAAHTAGVIWYRDWEGSDRTSVEGILAHERVHVGQYDFLFTIWSEPAESWLSKRIPGAMRVHRYVDFGLHLPAWRALSAVVPYHARPWEREAYFLVKNEKAEPRGIQ